MADQTTEKQKLMNNEYYIASDPELAKDRARCRSLLDQFNAIPPQSPDRHPIAEKLFGSWDRSNFINVTFQCDYGHNIFFGKGVELNYNCVFLDCGKIRLGNNVFIGPAVQIYAVNHPLDPAKRVTGEEIGLDVIIGDAVWLGGGAIICPGVTIGEGSVIGAGAVVTRDIPPNSVAVGNPAKVTKTITPQPCKIKL